MIKRIASKKYVVMSADGKQKLSKPMPHGAAKKRLQQIEAHKQQQQSGGY